MRGDGQDFCLKPDDMFTIQHGIGKTDIFMHKLYILNPGSKLFPERSSARCSYLLFARRWAD